MRLMKFPLVTSDNFVVNSAIVLDAEKFVESVAVGSTLTLEQQLQLLHLHLMVLPLEN